MSAAWINGKRVAVFGLGRSGLAIARATRQLGGDPHVFDETPLNGLSKPDTYGEAIAEGLCVSLGWTGEFSEEAWDLIVANPAISARHPKLLHAVASGLRVIGEVEFAWMISNAPIVAITGTNGKSTTTVMTYLCLLACGEEAILCGNIFGSGYPEVPLTEAALNSTPSQILVAEISSFQLEWVREFSPAVAGITNITPDHLDRYDSFEQYAATKLRIFSGQTEGQYAIVRSNDPVVAPPGHKGTAYRARGSGKRSTPLCSQGLPSVLTFGSTAEHSRVDDTHLSVLGRSIPLSTLPFGEQHNYANAAMAALLAYAALAYKAHRDPESLAAKTLQRAAGQHAQEFGVLPVEIIEGLKSFRGLTHRMEYLGTKNGVRVINNSMCTNPDAVIKSAQAVRDPAHLLIGGLNKHLDFKPLKNYLANRRNKPYLFGVDRLALAEEIGGDAPTFETMNEAFAAAAQAARSGEVIMLAPGCASSDQFRDFRDRGNVFKSIAKEWLDS